ncbi:MAG: PAS domain-containing protein, partial [Myxococcota bacterium]
MTGSTIPPIAKAELARIRAEATDFANIGLFRYRFDGTIVFFDPGALRLLDLEGRFPDPSAIVGLNIGDLLEYLDPPGRLREAVRKHGKVRNFEYRYRTVRGRVRWVYHNSYLITDPTTGEQQIQVVAQDITLLKETARALKASERRYRVLAEQLPQGIGVL